MRNKKLFKSVVIITASLFLFTGCGKKAEPVNAEPTETVSEVDTEESLESTEPTPAPTVETIEEPVEESSSNEESESDTSEEEESSEEESLESEETEPDLDYTIESIEPITVWAATNCNLRSGPGTQYDIVGSLAYAQEIIVDGKVEKDGKQWFVLQSDTEEKQMVSGSLIVYQKPQPQQTTKPSGGGSSSGGDNGGGSSSGGDTTTQQPADDGPEDSRGSTNNPWGVVPKDSGDMDWSGDSDWVWQ